MNRALGIRLGAFLAMVLVIGAVFGLLSPQFLSQNNIAAIFRHMSADGIAGLGLTFVIVVRRFDLSFPGIAALGAMTTGQLIALGYPLFPSILGGITLGAACGIINGLAISVLMLPDIVTTIAMGSIAYGLSFIYSNGATISDNFMESGILDINDQKIAYLDEPIFFMLVLYVFAWIVLHRSRFGRAFYATGENPRAALFSGVHVRFYVIAAFVLTSATAVWAGILHCAEAGQADPSAGDGFLTPAFASVYLGAALFGFASVPATFAGTLLISMMLNGFTLLSVPYYYSDAIISIVLISAIAFFDPRFAVILQRIINMRSLTGAYK
ncbi:MAG TPA: ABC transporter permease [Acidocella sp.]|nr:ABC transporter permease [Acidocella sp.]